MRRRQNSALFTDCSINYHPCGVEALSNQEKDGTYLTVLYFVCKGKRAEQVGATELDFFRLYIEKMCFKWARIWYNNVLGCFELWCNIMFPEYFFKIID